MNGIRKINLPYRISTGHFVCIIGLLGLLISSCTSSRWVIKDKKAMDPEDYKMVSSKPNLVQQGEITPETPVLKLALFQKNTYRYKEKVLAERQIQEYRPRWIYTGISLVSSAIAFYTAHSDLIVTDLSQRQTLFFNILGGALALSPFINMKPVAPPIHTGETKFLRVTGSRSVTKIEKSSGKSIQQFQFSLIHNGDSLIKQRKVKVQKSVINLNLVELVNEALFNNTRSDTVQLAVGFKDSTYHYQVPVSNFLNPYARITAEFSELRNAPVNNERNILTELARNSMLELVEPVKEGWYKVRFGIKESFIEREDVRIVWRPATFEQSESIVAITDIPFGEIDVESNVPVLKKSSPGALGLIIAGEDYKNALPLRKYALRDARLMSLYLRQALGYPDKNVHQIRNYSTKDDIGQQVDRLKSRIRPDTSRLFVYLSGHVTVREKKGEYNYYVVPVNLNNYRDSPPRKMLDLEQFLRDLSRLKTRYTVVMADFDFHNLDPMLKEPENIRIIRPLASIARRLTEFHSKSAVIFSSKLSQSSQIYYQKSEIDKKHRIFPYYFAKSLQQRNTSLEKIMNFLQRNVNYTSRKLQDKPQTPQLFGNEYIKLIESTAP